jgi:hypothetical protein
MGIRIVIAFLMLSQTVMAKTTTLKLERGEIFFSKPSSWQVKHDLFGIKNWLFSPKENGIRSNLTITDTKVNIELNSEIIKKNHESYVRLKQNWARKVNATPVSYSPLILWKNQHGHFVNEISFNYVFKKKQYQETSYYLECRGNLVYIKSLMIMQNQEHKKDLREVVNSMDCNL